MRTYARHRVLTLADYLEVERASPTRHEFVDGQVLAMAGGSPRHNYLCVAVTAVLRERLRGTACFPMGSDQRVATPDGLYTYPDGAVFCGALEVTDGQTATNPVVLVEVLSDSTRGYDRGEKLERYKGIPSLRHVLLVESDAVDVEVWTRAESGDDARPGAAWAVRCSCASRTRSCSPGSASPCRWAPCTTASTASRADRGYAPPWSSTRPRRGSTPP